MRSLFQLFLGLAVVAACGLVVWQGAVLLGPDPPPAAADPPPSPPPGEARPRALQPPPLGAPVPLPGPQIQVGAWPRRNQAGLEALEAGELEEAIDHFTACREGDPGEWVYARNLAEALARQATRLHENGSLEERAGALELLARARDLDPDREGLGELLDRWRRSEDAEQDFFHEISAHFELSYDLNRPRVRRAIVTLSSLLEEAYLEFGEAFGFWPVEDGRPRIRVVLYTREDFDTVTGMGEWAGGAYDGTIRVPVADLDRELPRLGRVLRHELLHAFVQEAGGATVPGWLNEGLAQWLETTQPQVRRQEAARARTRLAGGELFELESLGGSLASWTDREAIARAYAQALALVAHLEGQYGERILFDMVTGHRGGIGAGETFRRGVGVGLDTALEDLRAELER